jgi:hypothetical protein
MIEKLKDRGGRVEKEQAKPSKKILKQLKRAAKGSRQEQ